MKNALLILLFFSVFAMSAQKARFGIFGGVGYYDAPSYKPMASEEIKAAAASIAGAFVDYNVMGNYGILFHLGFNKKKIVFEERVNLNYIDLGLLLKMDLDGNYGKGFYFYGGPKVSLLTSVNIKDVEVEDGFNNTQFGLMAGAGAHLNKFLELDVFLDADTSSVLSRPGQQVRIIGFGIILKLEMNAMLNWHIPSVDPLNSN